MGVWDVINDLVEAATPWSTAEAEAPPAEDKDNTESQDDSKDSKAEAEDDKEEEGEEEEEEEEELEDPKDKFEEECRNSKQCAPAKHHFDECVERVTNASDDDEGEKEDCVEEFFHLAHCATQCAAPKLWSVLK
ncbi:ubiquinol-cytochrome C reductase hinge protein-domain-containing protein [Xylaria arbuscula]|nr:ubiquinol-cytochrome C reductase hinge protein-domain-containing protein [Xylaria arbuscula]